MAKWAPFGANKDKYNPNQDQDNHNKDYKNNKATKTIIHKYNAIKITTTTTTKQANNKDIIMTKTQKK